MQLGSDVRIPDGLLAANTLLSEKPHQGLPSWNPAPHQGIDERNCTALLGLHFRSSEIASGTVDAPNNNGNIWTVLEGPQGGTSQSFNYDSLNRLTSAYSVNRPAASTYNFIYNYDSFGNMLPVDQMHTPMNYGIDAATNRITLNGDLNIGDLRYYPSGELQQTPAVYGYHNLLYTAEGFLRSIDNYSVGSYLYNGKGERTLAIRNNQDRSEYVYFNSQPMAELADNSVWTDFIYANGQKIAQVKSAQPIFQLAGMRDSSTTSCGIEGPVQGLASNVSGYTIAPGDYLAFDLQQNVPTYGGLAFIFTTASASGDQGSGGATDSTTGMPLYVNSSTSQSWQHLQGSLSNYVGRTISYVLAGIHHQTPYGAFQLQLTNAVIGHSDGTVSPLLTGQSATVAAFSGNTCGGYNLSSGVVSTPTDSSEGAHYYLADQVGTTQMELSAGGWPVWQGSFTPFGQEIINGGTQQVIGQTPADGTTNRYKFTGKERDTESGLDYFGARYYGSNMGRWLSPDPSMDSAIMELPQTWNKYSYVYNRPTFATDPDGRCPPCIGAIVGGVVEGGFDLGKQLYNNGWNLSGVSWGEVGANALGVQCRVQSSVQLAEHLLSPTLWLAILRRVLRATSLGASSRALLTRIPVRMMCYLPEKYLRMHSRVLWEEELDMWPQSSCMCRKNLFTMGVEVQER